MVFQPSVGDETVEVGNIRVLSYFIVISQIDFKKYSKIQIINRHVQTFTEIKMARSSSSESISDIVVPAKKTNFSHMGLF